MEEYKHYIRLDSNNFIIKGFSNAFEQPLETDICINQNGGRHFELNGQINPSLFNNGMPIYKWDGTNIVPLTDTDKTNYLASLPPSPPTETELLQNQINDLNIAMANIMGV